MNEKNTMIAYCGLNCEVCPVFVATQKDDDSERKVVAEKWSNDFNWDLKPSDIHCDGCKMESGRVFGFCRECKVRECSGQRGLNNCATCDDYGCEKLEGIFALDPAIRAGLEEIRRNLGII